MTLTDFLDIVAAYDLRDASDQPLTADDYPAFEIAVDFLSKFGRPVNISVNVNAQPMTAGHFVSPNATQKVMTLSRKQWSVSAISYRTPGLTSRDLANRAERFGRMTGRQIDIAYPVMAAAILALRIPQCDFSGGMISTFIKGHEVKDALDDLKVCRDIMRKPPSPVDEAVVLAKLALHGIDAPDHVIRLALAERPDRIVAVVREPGSHWMSSVPLLTRPWSVKLGLGHLLDDFGGK